MTNKQRQAMIKFHKRAELAYGSAGNTEKAEAARRLAEQFEGKKRDDETGVARRKAK